MKSIIRNDTEYCYLCGKRMTGTVHKHHIFGGTANRKKSEEDGLFVYLHPECHRWLHDHPISMGTIHRRGQRIWEQTYNKTTDEFIKRYGRNYND